MKITKLIIFAFVLSYVGCANASFASEVTGNLSTGLTSSVNETLTGTVVNLPVVIPTNTGGGSSSGGGGGRSFIPAPASTSTLAASSMTTAELQILIMQLTNQLNALLAKKGEVLGANTYKFSKTLKKGITSDHVKELQDRLRAEKFFILPVSTRFFGNATFDAVKKYQKANKLPSTGFVGPLTIAELNK
jgi:hypothetical protein